MGTSLTGLTPATTYDALIKVGDNGPLSATAKVLSDGLGNDSILALSTAGVGIGNSTPSSFLSNGNQLVVGSGAAAQGITIYSNTAGTGNLFFADGTAGDAAYRGFLRYDHADDSMQIYTNGANERMRITSAGNVGIGTSTPTSKLTSIKTITSSYGATGNAALSLSGAGSTNEANLINFGYDGGTQQPAYIGYLCTSGAGSTRGDLVFATRSGTSDTAPSERVRITADGLTFNGDTAAANALDDYEEGTWTPTFNAAVTTSGTPTGKYTKVGRTVYATCAFTYTALTGADINISGLPFTNGAIRQATAVAFAGVARTTNQFFGTLVEASANNFYIEVVNSASGVSLTAHASCWYQV